MNNKVKCAEATRVYMKHDGLTDFNIHKIIFVFYSDGGKRIKFEKSAGTRVCMSPEASRLSMESVRKQNKSGTLKQSLYQC